MTDWAKAITQKRYKLKTLRQRSNHKMGARSRTKLNNAIAACEQDIKRYQRYLTRGDAAPAIEENSMDPTKFIEIEIEHGAPWRLLINVDELQATQFAPLHNPDTGEVTSVGVVYTVGDKNFTVGYHTAQEAQAAYESVKQQILAVQAENTACISAIPMQPFATELSEADAEVVDPEPDDQELDEPELDAALKAEQTTQPHTND